MSNTQLCLLNQLLDQDSLVVVTNALRRCNAAGGKSNGSHRDVFCVSPGALECVLSTLTVLLECPPVPTLLLQAPASRSACS
jgi:hypothetical protein